MINVPAVETAIVHVNEVERWFKDEHEKRNAGLNIFAFQPHEIVRFSIKENEEEFEADRVIKYLIVFMQHQPQPRQVAMQPGQIQSIRGLK